MFAKERQDKIYDIIKRNGAVLTSELVDSFHISTETVRRDLLYMEGQGRLTRVHGGAVAKGDMTPLLTLRERHETQETGKRELALKAMDFISEGDVIGIGEGSTAIYIAAAIRESFSHLTVVTYSRDVFEILCDHADIQVILCGGRYMREEKSFYGDLTLEMLKQLYVQKVFIFPSAISLEYGIFDYSHEMYAVQKQMMASSDEIYVLADSSKFEKRALLKVDDMSCRYRYITDSGLPENLRILYAENGINIVIGDNEK